MSTRTSQAQSGSATAPVAFQRHNDHVLEFQHGEDCVNVPSVEIEERYLAIVELARSLTAAISWEHLGECVATVLAPNGGAAVRLWAMLPDGPQEVVRQPANGVFPLRDARVLRRAAASAEAHETDDGYLLLGLQAAGTARCVLEISATSADEELVLLAAPLIALRAGALAGTGDGAAGDLTSETEHELARVISGFAAQAKQLLDHDRLSAYLVTADGRSVERFGVATSPVLPGEGVVVPFSDFGLRHILLTNRALISADLGSDPRIVGREDRVIAQAGYRGLLSVPLRLDGKPFGVLNFVSRRVGFYGEQDAPVAQQLADQVAVFFEHLRRQRTAHLWTRHAVAEHERARLARELHSTLAKSVPELSRGAREVAEGVASQIPAMAVRAQALADDAERALADTRRALASLVPPALESHTLDEVIEAELDLLRDAAALDGVFTLRGDDSRITLAARRSLYRIVQEALSNVRHHAQASRVEVTLAVGRDLMLAIEDNGCGFDADEVRNGGGLGLRFMRERAQSLGGTVRIDSVVDHGTTVTIELPDVGQATDAAFASQRINEQPMTGLTLRVFVIERHPLLLAGITKVLDERNDVRVVGQTTRGADAHRHIARLRPDVVLLDIDAAPEEAEGLTRQIKLTSPTTTVIGMSDMGPTATSRLAEQGASGVVAKDRPGDDLVEMIIDLAGGGAPDQSAEGIRRVMPGTQLTPRERTILALVAAGQTNAEIGESLFLATKTIERHVASIADKLGAQNRAHAAALAVATGLVRLDQPT